MALLDRIDPGLVLIWAFIIQVLLYLFRRP